MATALPAASGVLPAHSTVVKLVSDVLAYVQGDPDDGELSSVALEGLNHGIRLINLRDWHSQHAQSDLTMTANDDDIGLPSNFKKPIACFKLNSSGKRVGRLHFLPLKSLLIEYDDNSTASSPEHYSINYVTRELILQVQPSSDWVSAVPTIRLFYHRRLPLLTQDSSATVGEPDWDAFLLWHARRELAAVRDPQKFGIADRMAQRYWSQMIRDDTDQMTDWSEWC